MWEYMATRRADEQLWWTLPTSFLILFTLLCCGKQYNEVDMKMRTITISAE